MQTAYERGQRRKSFIHTLNCRIDGKEVSIYYGLQQLRQRVEANEKDSRSWFQLANVLLALKRQNSALSALEKANEHAPHVLDVIVSLAELLIGRSRQAEALELLSSAREHQNVWQFWGSAHALGQQFIKLYNGLCVSQGLPIMHPASLKSLPPSKIGRNDACFCGSGKKYKKCCG